MSHIWGKKECWEAEFHSFEEDEGVLVLNLMNGTSRTMNDWNEDTLKTKYKLQALKAGDRITVVTWGGYLESKWFCDVEKI